MMGFIGLSQNVWLNCSPALIAPEDAWVIRVGYPFATACLQRSQ